MRQMKVALIGPTYPFRGGIAHYTTLLYRHLRSRHEVRFFSFKRQYPRMLFPGKSDKDPSLAHIRVDGAERIIDSINPVTWVRAAGEINRFQPDIVIIPWWVAFWTPQFLTIVKILTWKRAPKILFICHNVVAHEATALDQHLTGLVLKTGDYFIVHSDEDRINLLRILPDAIVRKHFHPSYDVFNFNRFDPEQSRAQLALGGRVLLFFGFVRQYKGLKYLIRAMPAILAKTEVTLLVVGEFWKDKSDYLDLIDQLEISPYVRIVDQYVPNERVGLYFSAADLVVQPYLSATGSGVVQVAFGFEKPVVATRVGSLPEIVDDGKTGYLVSPGSASEIADAVNKFFGEDKAGLFVENIRKEKYRFSWDQLVDGIEALAGGKGGE